MPQATQAVDAAELAAQFCSERGAGWSLGQQLGVGGTAPVFEVQTPTGPRALKIYDAPFSRGEKGEIEEKRIAQQVALGDHTCPSLVQVDDGGWIHDRLFLLMSRAPGRELEKRLLDVPRSSIRRIVHQVAEAAIFLKSRDLCHRDIKAANVFVSDDFSQATLLDISVIRNVHDPIGVGTDHDGALPVVATARYSPPEYLFRLLDPTPELWHALSVYQLGGLLHDLIMRTPLFEAEHASSKGNRYRFAWFVATSSPRLEAGDVDRDLLLLATRALDKQWQRRSKIALEDFLLEGADARRKHSLQVLGLNREIDGQASLATQRARVLDAAQTIKQAVVQYFATGGVMVQHDIRTGQNDLSKQVEVTWGVAGPDGAQERHQFVVRLSLVPASYVSAFETKCFLICSTGGAPREVVMELPDTPDQPNVESTIARQVEAAFEKLAEEAQQAIDDPEGA